MAEPTKIIGDRKTWPMAAKPGERGPLVAVEISPGRFVKMYEQDAIQQGLIEVRGEDGEEASSAE